MDQKGKSEHVKSIDILLFLFLTGLVIGLAGSMLLAEWQEPSLPPAEANNAEQAYRWYLETHDTSAWGQLEGPTCSLMARAWIDEYRECHNLTREEYLCAVWYNDMHDWFYH